MLTTIFTAKQWAQVIFQYIDEKLIFFLDSKTKDDALKTLIHTTVHVKKLPDGDVFYQAILEREKIVSTGIGMGVAFPHAKLANFSEFFIGIGILKKGVDWHAIDSGLVRLVFLIGGPDDKQNEYLKILSALTNALRNEDLRRKLLFAATPKEVFTLFEEV